MLNRPLGARLQSKSVKKSIISRIARDFNLTPILAEAYFSEICDCFLHHAELELGAGQCLYRVLKINRGGRTPPSVPFVTAS
jgi:hypothetical protein